MKIYAQALDLSSGCALTRDGVSIEGSDSPITDLVYVDSVYSGSVENGSVLKPYKSLSGALQAKLTDASTTSYVFKLAPGVYTGGISIDQSSKNQSFKIEGSGDETIIQSGTTFSAGKDTNVLYFRDFKTIELASCTVRNGLYGFYPRACDKVICHDVKFQYLGSDGTVNRHNLTGTQAEQAAFWGSTSTSSGGACRIREIGQLDMYDCEVSYCLRGLRLQDVGTSETNSIVSNCKIFRTLEAGVYLAAGNYTGSSGCINFSVTGCFLTECGNDSLMCIGAVSRTTQLYEAQMRVSKRGIR